MAVVVVEAQELELHQLAGRILGDPSWRRPARPPPRATPTAPPALRARASFFAFFPPSVSSAVGGAQTSATARPLDLAVSPPRWETPSTALACDPTSWCVLPVSCFLPRRRGASRGTSRPGVRAVGATLERSLVPEASGRLEHEQPTRTLMRRALMLPPRCHPGTGHRSELAVSFATHDNVCYVK